MQHSGSNSDTGADEIEDIKDIYTRESFDTGMVLWVGSDEKGQLYKIVGYSTSLAYLFILTIIPDQWLRFEGTQWRDSKVFILNNATLTPLEGNSIPIIRDCSLLPIVEGTANFEVAVPEPVKILEINPTGSLYYILHLLSYSRRNVQVSVWRIEPIREDHHNGSC